MVFKSESHTVYILLVTWVDTVHNPLGVLVLKVVNDKYCMD